MCPAFHNINFFFFFCSRKLIDSACRNYSGYFLMRMKKSQWQEVIDLILTGVFLCTQVCMSEVLFSTEVQNFKHSLNQDSITRIFWKA